MCKVEKAIKKVMKIEELHAAIIKHNINIRNEDNTLKSIKDIIAEIPKEELENLYYYF